MGNQTDHARCPGAPLHRKAVLFQQLHDPVRRNTQLLVDADTQPPGCTVPLVKQVMDHDARGVVFEKAGEDALIMPDPGIFEQPGNLSPPFYVEHFGGGPDKTN